MPGWFDVKSLRAPLPGNPRSEEDEEGILASVNKIHALVEDEIKDGIDENRIVVGGFSQGAAMSLLVGVTTERKVGIVSLCRFTGLACRTNSWRASSVYQAGCLWIIR